MLDVPTTIQAVTVFTQQARITRAGSVHLEPGEHILVVSNLPTSLIEDSVRASGRGAGATLLGVDVRTEHLPDAPEEQIAALHEQLDTLRGRDKALVDEDGALDHRLNWLRELASQSGGAYARALARGAADLEAVTALGDYLAAQETTITDRRREIAQERERLAREIAALEARLKSLRGRRIATRRAIHVSIQAASAGDFTLEVEYAVHGASWQPLYDLRLEDTTVSLGYLAQVTQSTGEDWPEVALALSTARPAISTELPELDPWYIDVLRPAPPPMPKARMMRAASPAAAPMMAEAADEGVLGFALAEEPAALAQAAIESEGGASVTYRVAHPAAVPSDGSPHKTGITTLKLDAKLDYLTVPRLAEEAYLRAKITNTSEYMLLPGQASVFHGADFVGRSELDLIAPSEEFEVQMGIDDRIRVEHKLVRRDVSKALIGTTRRSEFAYRITLTSLLNTPARITLSDHLPLSRHEGIKVKLLSAQPEPTKHDDLNILAWELELPPGKKHSVEFAFSVEHPRDLALRGLDV